MGAGDEARDVGQDHPAKTTQLDHAKVRSAGGERIGGYFRPGGAESGYQGAFAGVGHSNQSDVRNQLQFQPQPALLAGLTLGGICRGLVGGRGEVLVAQPAAPAAALV